MDKLEQLEKSIKEEYQETIEIMRKRVDNKFFESDLLEIDNKGVDALLDPEEQLNHNFDQGKALALREMLGYINDLKRK